MPSAMELRDRRLVMGFWRELAAGASRDAVSSSVWDVACFTLRHTSHSADAATCVRPRTPFNTSVSHLLLIAGYGGLIAFELFPQLIPTAISGMALIGCLIAMLAGGILGCKLSADDGNVLPTSCHT
jgi:hypothetical protein